jgi:hypothetical protein
MGTSLDVRGLEQPGRTVKDRIEDIELKERRR